MNEEHVKILKSSMEQWNRWRQDNWNIRPDLSGANLHGMDLANYNLDSVDMDFADLSKARLVGTLIRHSNVEQTNFENASMQGAQLSFSNLFGVSFKKANLTGALLENAVLVEADFTEAICKATKFKGANLLQTRFFYATVTNADFNETNIHEAQLYSDQFQDANVPLYAMANLEKKQKSGFGYIIAGIVLVILIFFFIGFNMYVMNSEKIGDPKTVMRSSIYKNMANVLQILGGVKLAEGYYLKAVKYNPEDYRIYYILGSLSRRTQNIEKAVEYYEIYLTYYDPQIEKEYVFSKKDETEKERVENFLKNPYRKKKKPYKWYEFW
ncbi:MAG: pentapeptide repeat-containing protein [Vulcanimicrobiota bacterium]